MSKRMKKASDLRRIKRYIRREYPLAYPEQVNEYVGQVYSHEQEFGERVRA